MEHFQLTVENQLPTLLYESKPGIVLSLHTGFEYTCPEFEIPVSEVSASTPIQLRKMEFAYLISIDLGSDFIV